MDWSGAQYYPNHSVTTQPYHPQVSLGVMTIKETYYGPKTTQLKGELWTIKELHDTYITPWDHGPLGGTGQAGEGEFLYQPSACPRSAGYVGNKFHQQP